MTADFETSLDLYQYGAASFYAGYGVLCWFFFRWYCRNIYFRGSYPENPRWAGAAGGKKRWTEFHDTDGPTDYMVRGAGQCCLVMSYSVLFVCKYMFAIRNILDGAPPSTYIQIGADWMSVQIATWCVPTPLSPTPPTDATQVRLDAHRDILHV
jgi:hypothetical protein